MAKGPLFYFFFSMEGFQFKELRLNSVLSVRSSLSRMSATGSSTTAPSSPCRAAPGPGRGNQGGVQGGDQEGGGGQGGGQGGGGGH